MTPLSDRQLLKITREFRRGILQGACADRMCFAVCAPLQGLLSACGLETELIEADFPFMDHVWLKLPDGRILDSTASQFSDPLHRLPAVYLGPLPAVYRRWMAEASADEATSVEARAVSR